MRSLAPFASVLLALAPGCAGNYYDSYKAKNPDAFVSTPTAGASLYETLAGIYAPPVAAYSRFVSKLDVLRLEGGEVRVLGKAEIDQAIVGAPSGDYGIVATVSCVSEVDMKRYAGEKVNWFLLLEGKLVAYDQAEFVDRCIVNNEFRPTTAARADRERLVTAHRDANFPRSMHHAAESYQQGLSYLVAGRLEDAAAMLRAGDENLDVSGRGKRHMDMKNAPAGLRGARPSEIDALREALQQGLERKGAVGAAPPTP